MAHADLASAESRWQAHVRYFRSHLHSLSHNYLSLDTSRMTALYFSLVALDVLGAVDTMDAAERAAIVEWIYGMQVVDAEGCGGFRGGTSLGGGFSREPAVEHDRAHAAMTYTALAALATLGDDLSRVDARAIVNELRRLQRPDGSFTAARDGCEIDVRFTYCAAAVSTLVGDASGVDVDAAQAHIASCLSYDGGYALRPGGEAHGGSTYCAVASRVMLAALSAPPAPSSLSRRPRPSSLDDDPALGRVVDWCARRQRVRGGIAGRPGKPPDSCYSFWVGAALRALGAQYVLDDAAVTRFVWECASPRTGGFCKYAAADGVYPDLLHSFYSVCWLSWTEPNLNTIDPLLGICARRRRPAPGAPRRADDAGSPTD